MFPSSTKREFRHFHVVVVQRWQRNVQKRVMHVQSCCFAKYKPIAFLPFSLPSPSSWLKLPSVRNRTAGRKGRQNACVWQTWQGYYLRVLSWSSLNIYVYWSLTKDLFKGKWSWTKCYFKQNFVTLVTQGLSSQSFLSHPVAWVHYCSTKDEKFYSCLYAPTIQTSVKSGDFAELHCISSLVFNKSCTRWKVASLLILRRSI